MNRDYRTVREIVGPLVLLDGAQDVKYGELVELRTISGLRHGQVLEVSGGTVLVQVFEGSSGMDRGQTVTRFLGHGLQFGVSRDIVGRVFNGLGAPIDGVAPILPDKVLDINGDPMNPYARDYPDEFIQTGISAIDGLNTLVRGQKLPIFSGSGLPHAEIAAQIARQARVLSGTDEFAVVFGAMGITFEEADYVISDFRKSGAINQSVLFMNLANDPVIERIATPRFALSAAEYLAFELGMHVLVILSDMTNYCEALREISAARKEVPGRRGYPGYLYTDLATIYERAGRIKGKTREDRAGLLNELFAAYARGRDAKELAIVLGESALTETDRTFVKFSDEFEHRFVQQGRDEDRSIEQTLSIGWELLSILPLQELKRVSPARLEKYMQKSTA